MKREAWLYIPLGLFFAVVCVAYFFLGRYDGNKIEWAGVTALALCALMIWMIGGFIHITGSKLDDRPEDRLDAEVIDAAGDVGFFPPRSIWPFAVACAAGLIFLGPIFGWWLTGLGAAFGAIFLAGWIFQYYRGDYSH